MADEPEIRAYPPWKHALREFLESGFNEGDTVPYEWFYIAFNLQQPKPDTDTAATVQKIELQFLSNFNELAKALLEDHQICLSNVRSVGYRWVPPPEQTQLACEDGSHELRKALRKAYRRMVNVDHSRLSAEQRRENADAISRLHHLRQETRRARLPHRKVENEEEGA